MRILVTGGGGFLGGYVVKALLEENYQVVVYQRSGNKELQDLGAFIVRGAITDDECLRQAMQGCDAVIHIAALAGVWGSKESYFYVNIEGTRRLLATMEELGVRKLVYCSSPSVVFNGGHFRGEDESLPYGSHWLSPYPESKAEAESLVLEWGRSDKGVVIALRPHLIWGAGDPHLLPSVIQRHQLGRLRIIGNGLNRVDTTRVENAAAAHVLALHALDRPSAINRAYFISQGDHLRLWEWVNDLLERLDMPSVKRRIPYRFAYWMGGLLEVIWKLTRRNSVPPMTRFVAMAMARDHWFSIDAARRELGYCPETFPTDEGLDLYVEAWRQGATPRQGK